MWEKSISPCSCLHFGREEERGQSRLSHKKVTFNLSDDEDSEGEDVEDILGGKAKGSAKSEAKSSFEKRQERVNEMQLKRGFRCLWFD